MGKGEAVMAVSPDEHMQQLVSAAALKEKSASKEKKKEKKDKRDRKEKKEKKEKKRKHSSDDSTEEKDAIQASPRSKKAKTEASTPQLITNGVHSSVQSMEDDIEDTNIGLGTVLKEKAATNDVSSFGMSTTTVKLLKDKGIQTLFDIQAATFKKLRVEKKDVIGRAKTGSGKTLAFVLPIVETIAVERLNRVHGQQKPLVLCLAPTRELAQQVHRDFDWIASGHGLSTACFTGGSSKGPQFGALRRGLDVLVGTPGRIIDHLDEGSLCLGGVRFVVLDEADEMLSMGFQEAVERILGECSTADVKQTLLFSATVPRWVKELARKYMREDATVTVDTVSDDKNRTNSDITHLAIACPPTERGETIADVVKVYTGALGKTIIFTDTKVEANEVASMEKLINTLGGVGILHGDIPQGQREATLAAYRRGKVRVLVATDVAARGLDIKAVDLILQTHPPTNYETYIHRSGRTGRAGMSGTCVTFYGHREKYLIGLIEHKAGIKFKRANPPQPSDIIRASVSDTVKTISSVHSDNLGLFREVAKKVVESYNGKEDAAETALAASLACMAGYTGERFKTRSLLTCFQGFTAGVLSGGQWFESTGHAWSVLKRLIGAELASEVKGMQLCKDRCKAVFDAPEKRMAAVKKAVKNRGEGFTLEVPTDELPEMEEKFDLKEAMNNLQERRQFYRGKREGGGGHRGFGRGDGYRGGARNGSRGGYGGFRGRKGEHKRF